MSSADGVNFEDQFNSFKENQWKKDESWRHCGVGSCMFASEDNVQFINHQSADNPIERNELRISMRNDCSSKEDCCKDARHCTSYTSGQITSQREYSYGSFHFDLQVATTSKEFYVESTSYKSIECFSAPSSVDFPRVMKDIPAPGYCVNDNADLFKYHSNRDLCDGIGRNICARYTWIFRTETPGTFNFKADGNGIDLSTVAIYLDGKLLRAGDHSIVQDFDLDDIERGQHKVEIFGYEDCCAGDSDSGYLGWTLSKKGRWKGVGKGMFYHWSWKKIKRAFPRPNRRPSGGDPGVNVPPLLNDFDQVGIDSDGSEEEWDNYTTEQAITTGEIAETTNEAVRDPGGPSGYGNDDDKPGVSLQRTDSSDSMHITVPEGATEKDLRTAISQSMAEKLGVEEDDIEINIDMNTGAIDVRMKIKFDKSGPPPRYQMRTTSMNPDDGSQVVHLKPDRSGTEETTSEIQFETTGERSSTSEPDTEVLPERGAFLCVALFKWFVYSFGSLLSRISMCLSSKNGRQAAINAGYGDELFSQVVDLPFDATSKIGHYSIDWLPDRIVWNVDNVPIAEVHSGMIAIPSSPMHMKLFVAPYEPIQKEDSLSKFIEHELHVYSAGYNKYITDKDELIVLGESVTYYWRLVILGFGIICVILMGLGIYGFRRRKTFNPDGYEKLLQNEAESHLP